MTQFDTTAVAKDFLPKCHNEIINFIAFLLSMKSATIWYMANCSRSFLTNVIHSWLSKLRSVLLNGSSGISVSMHTINRVIYQLLRYWPLWLGHTVDMLNVASTGIYTILALIVNFKENACKKMNVIAKIRCYNYWAQCRYTEIAQNYLNSDTQYISLTLDKELNSWTVWYIERYFMSTYTGVTNCQKTVRFLAHLV